MIRRYIIPNLKGLPFHALVAGILFLACSTASGALLAHYRFNGDLSDETGNHNATLRDPVETFLFLPGRSGDAVAIEGVGTSLEVAGPGEIDFAVNFTIAAWVNTIEGRERCLVYKGHPSAWVDGNKQFNLYGGGDLGDSGLFFYAQGQGAFGSSFEAAHGINVTDGNWHHVAFTYDATNTPRATLWVDGIAHHWDDPGRYASMSPEPLLKPDLPNTVLRIGGREAGSGDTTAFSGLIDELQIHNRALTTNEILLLFNNPGEVIPPPDIPEIAKQPQGQTITIGPAQPGKWTFSVTAEGKAPLQYQWQFNGADLGRETNATLVLSTVATHQAGVYTVVVNNAFGTVTSDPAPLTVNMDSLPPTVISARTLGDANRVTVVFSEALADPPSSASFAIDNGITVTGATGGDASNRLQVLTSSITIGPIYTLTVKGGVKDLYGNEIVPNSQASIDLSVEVPLEFGQMVNGFQDDFSGATRDANWVPVGEDAYAQTDGRLHITAMSGNPNHLLYQAPDYNGSIQEVLARIRVLTLPESQATACAGIAVASNPEAAHAGEAINLIVLNTFSGVEGLHARLLDDYRAWGSPVPNFAPQFQTWYWLRLRQTSSTTIRGPNIQAKAWRADGSEPEPAQWQLTWGQEGRMGFAGITGPILSAATEAEVDYILIKASGLPSIRVAPASFSLVPPSTLDITQQPQDVTTSIRTRALFTIAVSGKNLTYQWQQAPASSAQFADIPGATSASYTTAPLVLANNGSRYRCVVGALLSPSLTSREAMLTVTEDVTPPTLVSAKTLGNPNQVTVIFSETIRDPAVTHFAVDNGISITGVRLAEQTNTILLATSAFSADTRYLLTVNGVKDLSGNAILSNSQIPVDMFIEVPLDYGQTVSGFQDDFSGATRDPNWVPVEEDAYAQTNGVLSITAMSYNPNHLLYQAPGYSDSNQEVLARIRVKTLPESQATACAGIAVASSPEAAHPGEAINLIVLNTFSGVEGLHARLLDDYRAWGSPVPNFAPQFQTWYWLRLLQTSSSSTEGPNIHAKAWRADGTEPEPTQWQLNWGREGRVGFAGITGPILSASTEAEVDYILIKADGLPSIKAVPDAFALVGPRLERPRLTVLRTGNDVVLTWAGGGTLESADRITGPWSEVTGASSPYSAAITGAAKFYRVRQS